MNKKQEKAEELKEKCKEFVKEVECSTELKNMFERSIKVWIGRCFAQEGRLRREKERQEITSHRQYVNNRKRRGIRVLTEEDKEKLIKLGI